MSNRTGLVERPRVMRGRFSTSPPTSVDDMPSRAYKKSPEGTRMHKTGFAVTAFAIETTEKAFRKTLQNASYVSPRPPLEGGRVVSTPTQLAVDALMRRQADFGLSIYDSSRFASAIVWAAMYRLARDKDACEVADLQSELSQTYAVITIDSGEPKLLIETRGWPDLSGSNQAMMILPVGAIVSRAFELARLSKFDPVNIVVELREFERAALAFEKARKLDVLYNVAGEKVLVRKAPTPRKTAAKASSTRKAGR